MKTGKLPNSILKEIILDKVKYKRDDILLRPGVGEDCCAIDMKGNACVLSSDPITGAVSNIGTLAVHINCNDIASCGIEPLGILVTILAPPDTTIEELDKVMSQITEAADEINVEILGGHTEITDAVNRIIISGTAVGKAPVKKIISTKGARPGDKVLFTGFAGLEGTAIISYDKEEEILKTFGEEFLERARTCLKNISVVKEGKLAGEYGVSAMHDVTEGGVLGAVWEMSEGSCVGARIYRGQIPVMKETTDICNFYGIDPLKLISSGCMLIACADGDGLARFLKENGVNVSIIGEFTETTEKKIVSDIAETDINEPDTDELYNIV
ncbi:MAG TPA: AIR synthase family protein [Clostridia bacterium]